MTLLHMGSWPQGWHTRSWTAYALSLVGDCGAIARDVEVWLLLSDDSLVWQQPGSEAAPSFIALAGRAHMK